MMGFLQRSTTVVSTRARAAYGNDPFAQRDMYSGFYPAQWYYALSSAGITITPELSLILTAMFSGVSRIGGDFMRMPVHVMRLRDDDGKDRIRGGPTSMGIGALAYRLRWKPNVAQTAAEFFACLAAQYVLRSKCYVEILPDETGPIGQLWPRHPDRVKEERLASGRLRFTITNPDGGFYRRTSEEMLAVHDTTVGGFAQLSRVQYGREAIGTALAADHAAARLFKSGMTAAVLATHPAGRMEPDEKAAFHSDLTRFATGAHNNFGVLLVEEDIKVTALGLDPEKAQMMLSRNFGVRDVARLLKMPPELLFADNTGTVTGRSWEEVNNVYHTGCLGQIVAPFEQAMHDALIVAKDTYLIEFLMDALFRGDLKSRAEYYAAALEGPWMWPSDVRIKENMNPDDELDTIFEKRYRPGEPKTAVAARGRRATAEEDRDQPESRARARTAHRLHLLLHDSAERTIRRERVAIEKIAKKHADHVEAWQAGVDDFYADHARLVAQTMRIDLASARAYCDEHAALLKAHGLVIMDEDWERREADELVALTWAEVA